MGLESEFGNVRPAGSVLARKRLGPTARHDVLPTQERLKRGRRFLRVLLGKEVPARERLAFDG